ncbi:E3 Ubiquitin-Protein Ligase Dzip3 [Manis pentadactyla]|nr:E3 Ubiquitin-Protein Ligase Dzip3 [Manis pentadactyla]
MTRGLYGVCIWHLLLWEVLFLLLPDGGSPPGFAWPSEPWQGQANWEKLCSGVWRKRRRNRGALKQMGCLQTGGLAERRPRLSLFRICCCAPGQARPPPPP